MDCVDNDSLCDNEYYIYWCQNTQMTSYWNLMQEVMEFFPVIHQPFIRLSGWVLTIKEQLYATDLVLPKDSL